VAFLELRNISKTYAGSTVLQDISLAIDQSAILSLLGLSGCGKTTLLRIIAGLEKPDSGSVWLDGEDITNSPLSKRPVGIVFQNYALFPHMTVFNNVAYGLTIQQMRSDVISSKVHSILETLRMHHLAQKNVTLLSGGEQQRVALARALVTEPRLLLLDEPLSNLDQAIREEARLVIQQLQQERGITTIYVTHDQAEALSLSDQMALMNQGRIEQVGTPFELYHHPQTVFTAGFVGHCNILTPEQLKYYFNIQIDVNASNGVVALLPEQVQLRNEMSGALLTVQAISFMGVFTELILADTQIRIKVRLPLAGDHLYTIGKQVSVSVNPDHVKIITGHA
jgi:ABC-type Fe3+/spermidine/putrescine transport system ATPase subunit